MADDEKDTQNPAAEDDPAAGEDASTGASTGPEGEEAGEEAAAPTQLGAAKYVHAAFFMAATLAGFLSGRILAEIWNSLAAWPAAVRAVPALLRLGEDERPPFTLAAGGVVGVIVLLQLFRRPELRTWSDDVALELSKVVWPTRETVTNGTIVVIVASAIATVYIGLLDRLWNFVTTLVYGA